MRFFPVLLPKLAVTKSICLTSSQEIEDLDFGEEKMHLPVQYWKPGRALEGVFHLLRHLALGTAGNASQTSGISMETSISAGRKQALTTKSSAVSASKAEER